jgi:hypothetical protein
MAPSLRHVVGLLSLCVVALLPACSCEDEPPAVPDDGDGCAIDDDCEPGFVCRREICVRPLGGSEGEGEGEAPVGVLVALPEPAVEFGAIRVGVPVERTLTLKNTGDAALTILQLVIDDNEAGTFRSEPVGAQSLVLQPGGETGVLLVHTPNDGVPDRAELKVLHSGEGGLLSVDLFAEFKGDATISITGDVGSLAPDVAVVDLGEVPTGESRTVTLFVRNDGAADSALTTRRW